MELNAGNDPSPSAVVVDVPRENVVAVESGAEGPVLPVRFNQIVAGEVGDAVARPADENRLPGRPLTAFFHRKFVYPRAMCCPPTRSWPRRIQRGMYST